MRSERATRRSPTCAAGSMPRPRSGGGSPRSWPISGRRRPGAGSDSGPAPSASGRRPRMRVRTARRLAVIMHRMLGRRNRFPLVHGGGGSARGHGDSALATHSNRFTGSAVTVEWGARMGARVE